MIRYAQILAVAWTLPNLEMHLPLLLVSLLVMLLLTMGLFTPFMTLLALLLVPYVDIVFKTSMLGSAISLQFLVVLLMGNASGYYSLDRSILQGKEGLLKKLVVHSHQMLGAITARRLRLAFFLGFTAYATVNFGALSYHIFDDFWLSGKTVGVMLTGSYFSKFNLVFREVLFANPTFFEVFSRTITYIQIFYQLLMLPLMFFRWGRLFVITWGWIFILFSLVFIELSILPHVEALLWLLILHPVNPSRRVKILFDDRCNLCKKSMKVLRKINFNGSILFMPLSYSSDLIAEHGLSEEEVRVWMCGVDSNNRVYKGYDLYIEIIKLNPATWVLMPIFLIGRWTRLGYMIYAQIAKHRYKIFGTCALEPPTPPPTIKRIQSTESATFSLNWLLGGYAILILLYAVTRFPVLSGISMNVLPDSAYNSIKRVTYAGGLEMPFVFNHDDLLTNQRWITLHRVSKDGSEELVPIFTANGDRMDFTGYDWFWLDNFGSDLLYCTLIRYKSALSTLDVDSMARFHTPGERGHHMLNKFIQLDQRYRGTGAESYRLTIYENKIINLNGFETEENYKGKVIFSSDFPLPAMANQNSTNPSS